MLSSTPITQERLRATLGFLLARLVPGIAVSILIAVGGCFEGGLDFWKSVETVVFLFVSGVFFSAAFGYPIAFLFGQPFYRFLTKHGYRRCSAYGMAGGLLGSLAWPVLFLLFYALGRSELPSLPNLLSGGVVGSACGAIAGAAFWLIARPDRTALTQQISYTNRPSA